MGGRLLYQPGNRHHHRRESEGGRVEYDRADKEGTTRRYNITVLLEKSWTAVHLAKFWDGGKVLLLDDRCANN
eukprot:7600580-Ditylum_brightwellii.AAC.1